MITRSRKARKKRTAAEANPSTTERGDTFGDEAVVSLEPSPAASSGMALPLTLDRSYYGVPPPSSGGLVHNAIPQSVLHAHRTATPVSIDNVVTRTAHQIGPWHGHHPYPSIAGIGGPPSYYYYYHTYVQGQGIVSSPFTTDVQKHPERGFTTPPVMNRMSSPFQQKPMRPRPASRLPADRPVMKLTAGLMNTYNVINKKYYKDRKERKAGHFSFTLDEIIYNRYQLKERLGMGSCGQVFKAIDTCNNKEVAVKMIKAKKGATMRAQTEIKLLTQMQERYHLTIDTSSKEHNIVHLLNTFMHKNHQCIVFEPLDITLYQLLVNTKFRGISLRLVRSFAKQLLQTLAYLARPDVDIIHCDLKPENVMLDPKWGGVKLIDFGSACKSSEKSYTYIQTRFYRSPEVMLGLPYSVAIDMWSLGCMLVELYTGEPLFAGLKNELDMMQKIVALMGMPPDEMIHQVKNDRQLTFFEMENGEWWAIRQSPGLDASQLIIPSYDPMTSLKEAINRSCASKEKPEENQEEHDKFVDMVFQMLTYQPENRLRPDQALYHPFFSSHG